MENVDYSAQHYTLFEYNQSYASYWFCEGSEQRAFANVAVLVNVRLVGCIQVSMAVYRVARVQQLL